MKIGKKDVVAPNHRTLGTTRSFVKLNRFLLFFIDAFLAIVPTQPASVISLCCL
jgi:hypothetical protein